MRAALVDARTTTAVRHVADKERVLDRGRCIADRTNVGDDGQGAAVRVATIADLARVERAAGNGRVGVEHAIVQDLDSGFGGDHVHASAPCPAASKVAPARQGTVATKDARAHVHREQQLAHTGLDAQGAATCISTVLDRAVTANDKVRLKVALLDSDRRRRDCKEALEVDGPSASHEAVGRVARARLCRVVKEDAVSYLARVSHAERQRTAVCASERGIVTQCAVVRKVRALHRE